MEQPRDLADCTATLIFSVIWKREVGLTFKTLSSIVKGTTVLISLHKTNPFLHAENKEEPSSLIGKMLLKWTSPFRTWLIFAANSLISSSSMLCVIPSEDPLIFVTIVGLLRFVGVSNIAADLRTDPE